MWSHVFDRFFAALSAAALLAGCGNAYERLEVGEWRPAGEAIAPSIPKRETAPDVFRVSVLAPGSGRQVQAGSVVHLRITARSGSLRDPQTLAALPNGEAWVWIGRAERPDGARLVDLGSALLRASIVGLHEGGTLAFYAKVTHIGRVVLPRRGFLHAFTYKPNWRQLIPSGSHSSLDEEYVDVVGDGEYELQVLRVCEGRLSRKTATLRQWGLVFNWGDAHYKFAREGMLEWVAMDIDCAPGERIRFEKGPAHGIYTPGYRDNPLLGWQESYEAVMQPGRVF